MEYYIGIDLGTSSVKLMLVDGFGNIKKIVMREYPVFYPNSGWSEQYPQDWWEAVSSAIPELVEDGEGKSIRGIGVAGQMHGLVILDDRDNIIRPAILWNDGRTALQTEYLNNFIGKEKLFEHTGNIAFAGFTAPKLLWLKENEPENFAKINKIMLPKDYVNYRLTGIHSTDFSDASGTLLLDVKNRKWSSEMLKLCSVRETQMPCLYESYEVVGRILPETADKFGISRDVVVVAGAGDNAAAAVGTGTVGEGRCNISLGTSGTIFASSDHFTGDVTKAIHSFCHADGGYHLMGCILSAALCSKWFCEGVLNTRDYGLIEAEIDEELLGRNEVFFLPYLMGERSPINDTDATGLFIGLRPNTTSPQMYLAVLEGVAFAIKDNLDVIEELCVLVSNSSLCGGGARSSLWRQILANVLGIELSIPNTEEGPGYGSAMLAMVGSGKFESAKKCAKELVNIKETIQPDTKLTSLYAERYEKFKYIYPSVKELYKQIKK
jgi:xylulokinase